MCGSKAVTIQSIRRQVSLDQDVSARKGFLFVVEV